MQRPLMATAVLIAMLLIPMVTSAQNLSIGNWVMNANGWKFVLEIFTLDSQGNFTGEMRPLNNTNSVTAVSGTVSPGGHVVFQRGNQTYDGYLFRGREKDRHMAGTFDDVFGWMAELQAPASSSTPQPPQGVSCDTGQFCCEPAVGDPTLCTDRSFCIDPRTQECP